MNIKKYPQIPPVRILPLKSSLCGVLVPENTAEEARPPHRKTWGSQIFMLGTPLILYVGILYVLLSPPCNL